MSLASSALIGLSEMEGRATDELEEFPQSTYLQWAICAAIGADPAELLEEAMKEEHNP